MTFQILGISGNPVNKGNVDTFLGSIMEMALEKGLETETINLSKMEIKNCVHCNFCLSK
jgi:multimeric flavodoxin WrbA